MYQGVERDQILAASGAREGVRAALGAGPQDVLIATVANYRKQKDYPNLFAAADLVLGAGAQVRFVAMGKGPDDIKAPLDTLRELTVKAGRSPDSLQINMLPLATPSLEQVVSDIPRYSELGVRHLYLSFRAWTAEFSQLMELMARFAREVGIKA